MTDSQPIVATDRSSHDLPTFFDRLKDAYYSARYDEKFGHCIYLHEAGHQIRVTEVIDVGHQSLTVSAWPDLIPMGRVTHAIAINNRNTNPFVSSYGFTSLSVHDFSSLYPSVTDRSISKSNVPLEITYDLDGIERTVHFPGQSEETSQKSLEEVLEEMHGDS